MDFEVLVERLKADLSRFRSEIDGLRSERSRLIDNDRLLPGVRGSLRDREMILEAKAAYVVGLLSGVGVETREDRS